MRAIAYAFIAILVGTGAALPQAQLPEGPLTLEQCIDIAWQNHSRVAIAQESVFSGEQSVLRARSNFYPEVGAQWDYEYGRSRGGSLGAGNSIEPESHQTSLYTSYNFWDSRNRDTNLRLAKTELIGIEANLETVRRDLAYQVTSDYYALLQARRNLEIANEAFDLADQNLTVAMGRIEAKDLAPADQYTFRSEVMNAKLNVVNAGNAVNIAATQLRNSLGLDLGAPLELVEPGMPTFTPIALEDLLATARKNRTELAAAVSDLEAAKLSVQLAKINRAPFVSVDGRFDYVPDPSPWGSDWYLSASLSVPIFDAGDRTAQVRSSEAALRQSQLRYDQLMKDVAAEVESAYFDVVSSEPSYTAASAVVTAAKSNLDAMTLKLRLGLSIALEVVDAQATYSNARIREAQTLYDYHVARGRLSRAIGGPLP